MGVVKPPFTRGGVGDLAEESGLVGDPANEDEATVAIAAVGKAFVSVDFQPHARMAERGVGEAVAGAVAGDAGFGRADRFGSGLCHRPRP